jgi:hypothetical protein
LPAAAAGEGENKLWQSLESPEGIDVWFHAKNNKWKYAALHDFWRWWKDDAIE